MTTAFVLSGGASLGAIQVGMLRVLAERDIRPDVIVGTSVGAVNGAFLACRDFGPEAVDELAELWLGIRRGQVFPVEPFTGLLGFLGARRNLVPGGALRRLLTRNTDCERFEDLATPLHVIACDVRSGQEVRISEGPLVDAVMASAAIPGVLPPVERDGRLLVDGGVLNNTPITHAVDLGADEIYVLPSGGPCDLPSAPRGALGMVVQATSLMVSHRFAAESIEYAGRAGLTILPPPCPIDVQPMDFGHAEELMARAETSARGFFASTQPDDSRSVGGRHEAPRVDPPLRRPHDRTAGRGRAAPGVGDARPRRRPAVAERPLQR
ncbi:MAG TPA: patatin-like phospholipase family protein [Solirubrobacteraceae bacterium]|jgi:NTE family protein